MEEQEANRKGALLMSHGQLLKWSIPAFSQYIADPRKMDGQKTLKKEVKSPRFSLPGQQAGVSKISENDRDSPAREPGSSTDISLHIESSIERGALSVYIWGELSLNESASKLQKMKFSIAPGEKWLRVAQLSFEKEGNKKVATFEFKPLYLDVDRAPPNGKAEISFWLSTPKSALKEADFDVSSKLKNLKLEIKDIHKELRKMSKGFVDLQQHLGLPTAEKDQVKEKGKDLDKKLTEKKLDKAPGPILGNHQFSSVY